MFTLHSGMLDTQCQLEFILILNNLSEKFVAMEKETCRETKIFEISERKTQKKEMKGKSVTMNQRMNQDTF